MSFADSALQRRMCPIDPLQKRTQQICPYDTASPLKPASCTASILDQPAQLFSIFCQQAL